jgi:diguanylate cyclase (GGDEF)-like protein
MVDAGRRDVYSTLYPEFRALLRNGGVNTVFQPIISLCDGAVLGYEALSRGKAGSALESPRVLFAIAEELGMTWELEYACRRMAIGRFAAFASDALLFLNVDPHVMQDPEFTDEMTRVQLSEHGIPAAGVVFELTEQAAIANHREFTAILEHYKAKGFRLAVDDAGSGYSGLNLICHVKPHFLKMDMNLVRNIHRDAFKQQLLKFTVDFAKATGISLIAEGIEQEAELLTILDLGVEYGQGFLFAHPQPELIGPHEEWVQRLCAGQHRRLENKLRHIVSAKVGDSCHAMQPYDPSTQCHQIETLFAQDESVMAVPIARDNRPVGLVMREKLYGRLGRQYGYSLFHNRPITTIMDPTPLIVDFNDSLEAVAQAAMQRPASTLYDHIIVTVQGAYFGLISVRDLLERITEQGIKYAQYSNPLTGLPGNIMIQREIERIIHSCEQFAVLYFDLDHFKAYNDAYGFDRGDEVLKLTAGLLQETFIPTDDGTPFVGHLGGDDFFVVLTGQLDTTILEECIRNFDARIVTYYDDIHREQGFLYAVNRRGDPERFPFISVSIAVVTEQNGPFQSYHELAKCASEVKQQCKMVAGSCYLHDRRCQ